MMLHPRVHMHPGFRPEVAYGAKALTEHSQSYDFATMHDIIKTMGFSVDFCVFGVCDLGLLLFFGDLSGSRAALAKTIDAHRGIVAKVKQGKATPEQYLFEAFVSAFFIVLSATLAGDLDHLREFLANLSPAWAAAIPKTLANAWTTSACS